ncbi:sigma-70 family RNA polymerase sigma factor [Chloroflexota bacterium]
MRKKDLEERRRKERLLAGLYEEYYDKIARYIFVRIHNRSESEDLAGDVFLRALESLDSYQERGVPMHSWLFRIAHNRVVDYFRKQGKRKTVPLDTVEVADLMNVEETVERQWQVERVSQAMAQLTMAQRDVIALRFFSGLSSEEVGKILGKSSGAVREMQSAGVKSLRRLIGDIS